VAAADVEDEAEVAADHLRGLGLGAEGLVLVVSRLSEAIHAVPFEKGAGRLGARYSSTDATAADAFRTAALVHQLQPDVVIGVNVAVVEGLRSLGRDPADVLAAVPAIAVGDAIARDVLAAAGLAPRRWLKVGPTNAVECEHRAGAHLDGDRWLVEPGDGGEVRLTGRVPRLTPCTQLATGIVGDVVTEPCACGRPGPRLVPHP
jgi:hypothetical protein